MSQPDGVESTLVSLDQGGWARLACEHVAGALDDVAEELVVEALRGGVHAAGLTIAARVLRDRAAEALSGS